MPTNSPTPPYYTVHSKGGSTPLVYVLQDGELAVSLVGHVHLNELGASGLQHRCAKPADISRAGLRLNIDVPPPAATSRALLPKPPGDT